MSDVSQEKPWWSITRTRDQSSFLGLLRVVVGSHQSIDLFTADRASWWRWAAAALLIVMASYYLAAWWTRGRRGTRDSRG